MRRQDGRRIAVDRKETSVKLVQYSETNVERLPGAIADFDHDFVLYSHIIHLSTYV